MIVIGVAGGIASGKSLVSKQLEELGATVLDADRVAHEVLRENRVKQSIKALWGDSVFDQQGEVSRSAVAELVFGSPPEGPRHLQRLEAIVHPRISQILQQRVDELKHSEGESEIVAVLDAAVMFKTGWDRHCDHILFVDAPSEQRYSRALQRGWSREAWQAREQSQAALDEKRARADVVIDNSGTVQDTLIQVQHFWNELPVKSSH